MDDKTGNLRRHAAHCRFMARGTVTQRTRTILCTMAIELEGQADVIDALKSTDPV